MNRAFVRGICGIVSAIGVLGGTSCGGRMPESLGVQAGALAACPASPNCVSSLATDAPHSIDAFRIDGDARVAWEALATELRGRERVEIVTQRATYLHAVFTSALMRYRDDVEFLLRPGSGSAAGIIDVRSASRVGYGDMGANRDRVESLRAALVARGVVVAGASD